MNTIRPYIIPGLIVLIVILCFGWLHSCEKAKNLVQVGDTGQLREDTARLQTEIRTQIKQVKSIQAKRENDSLVFASVLQAKESKIKALQRRREEIRPEVDAQTDSLPVVRRLIVLQDSTIQIQSEIITTQRDEIAGQSASYLQEIAALGAKNVQQIALTETWKTAAVERENDLKKANRRRRFWRSTSLVLGACVAVLILAN